MLWSVLLAVLVAVLVLVLGKQHLEQFAKSPISIAEPRVYVIESGTHFRALADDLEAEGIIADALRLRIFARLENLAGSIKSGEFELQPGISHRELVTQFVEGKVLQRTLTFVEGLRVSDYLALLASRDHEISQTLTEMSIEAIAHKLGIESGKLEGWIYPDTYHFTRGTTDFELLQRAYQRMRQVLEYEWQHRAEGLPLETPYEALILASIVEKETGVPEERPDIAGVFIRRLQKGMRLQTDPTVIYGMGDAYQGNIRKRDLLQPTPYNTYTISGLPPTPIANPAQAAIHATLHPAAGDALYFVAKGDGSHVFSATLSEHNQAVYEYQKSGRRSDYRSSPASN